MVLTGIDAAFNIDGFYWNVKLKFGFNEICNLAICRLLFGLNAVVPMQLNIVVDLKMFTIVCKT